MRNLKNLFDLKDRDNAKFWVSHLIVLFGTVLAVYLAASAGLKTAVQFEVVKSDRDSYYMRSALLDELSDNLDKIQKWGEEYKGGNARKFIGKPDDFVLVLMSGKPCRTLLALLKFRQKYSHKFDAIIRIPKLISEK